jgi:hypothetical protein
MSKLEKAYKSVGEETVKELEAQSPEDLKRRVVEASDAMKTVSEELEANDAYQQLRESKTALEQGRNEVNKRQKAIILIALNLLKEKGV